MIIASNHNSHLDTVLIFAILPTEVTIRARFAASGDYFSNIPIFSKFLFDFLDMVPIFRPNREQLTDKALAKPTPLETMSKVLDKGEVLVIYPEGTRGTPGERSPLKPGVARLALRYPNVPIYPVFIQGLDKALPKNSGLFIPLTPRIKVSKPIYSEGKDEKQILGEIEAAFAQMEMVLR